MMGMLLLLGQAAAAPPPVAPAGANQLLQLVLGLFAVVNLVPIVCLLTAGFFHESEKSFVARLPKIAGKFLLYEMLLAGACIMLLPFYWMIVTSFKDGRTAATFPPIWTPSRIESKVAPPGQTTAVPVVELETARKEGDKVKVVPVDKYEFKRTVVNGIPLTREIPDPASVFLVDPTTIQHNTILNLDLKNFRRAWYRPEDSSRGQVNFLTYFFVSTTSSLVATLGTLLSGALAAFAFARLTFYGKEFLFYMVLATMMVPGQVLLIPNFLLLSKLGWLDSFAALTVPWLASVFTIFLMRQFFMTIPEDLWDAARVDGVSRFRYLWQVVVPLSKPVFITAGIFDFLNNWNSLLWPLIVTSTPARRTLMVGLQNLNEEAGTDFHILMAASCFAIFPVVIVFFFMQRFFIEGIARTGLK